MRVNISVCLARQRLSYKFIILHVTEFASCRKNRENRVCKLIEVETKDLFEAHLFGSLSEVLCS